jgi:branched-chain amino acid transport system substrate-binding protein
MKRWVPLVMAGAMLAGPALGQELRLGFLSTTTGGGAAIGTHQVNGWKLGLEHEGWTKDGDKLGGVATRVFYADDQQRPDTAVTEIDRLLKQDKVHIVAGVIWSNVLLAVQRQIFAANVGLISTNAGASPLAGELCSPLFVSTSRNSDQPAEALGVLMTQEKLASVYVMAPNYQAGRDIITGLLRTLKGPAVLGQNLYKLGETDFQADISKIRAAKPAALVIFAPGAMGPAFIKQWSASGVDKEVKLYTVNTIDWLTLPAIGPAAIGAYEATQWSSDLDNEANKRFVKDYAAKFGHAASNYAAQAYDAARLVAASVREQKGNVADIPALMRAMRKVTYPSTRGPYTYNVNGMPVQNFYKLEVVKGATGALDIVNRGIAIEKHKDAHWEKCPPDRRS